MTPSDCLLNLLGHDLVRGDVSDVMRIPIEAEEIVEHNPSIY